MYIFDLSARTARAGKGVKKILIEFMVILCSSTLSFASSNNAVSSQISEFDAIMNLVNQSPDEVADDVEQEEIDQYKLDYANNIIEYSQLGVDELNQLGFSAEQIAALKKLELDSDYAATGLVDVVDANTFLKENLTRGLTGSVLMSVSK